MHIGELAKQGGVSVQTVRYYERYGLLKKPERTRSRYRVYGEKDVDRLRFILKGKVFGFTLDEIKHILELSQRHACPCGEVLRIGEDRLAELETRIAELTGFHDQLARAVREWKKRPEKAPPGEAICVLIERTMVQVDGSQERNKAQWPSTKVKSASARTRTASAKLP